MGIANLRGGLVEQAANQQVSKYLKTIILDSDKRVTEERQGVESEFGSSCSFRLDVDSKPLLNMWQRTELNKKVLITKTLGRPFSQEKKQIQRL